MKMTSFKFLIKKKLLRYVIVLKAFKASDSSWETMFLKEVGVQQIFFVPML